MPAGYVQPAARCPGQDPKASLGSGTLCIQALFIFKATDREMTSAENEKSACRAVGRRQAGAPLRVGVHIPQAEVCRQVHDPHLRGQVLATRWALARLDTRSVLTDKPQIIAHDPACWQFVRWWPEATPSLYSLTNLR